MEGRLGVSLSSWGLAELTEVLGRLGNDIVVEVETNPTRLLCRSEIVSDSEEVKHFMHKMCMEAWLHTLDCTGPAADELRASPHDVKVALSHGAG